MPKYEYYVYIWGYVPIAWFNWINRKVARADFVFPNRAEMERYFIKGLIEGFELVTDDSDIGICKEIYSWNFDWHVTIIRKVTKDGKTNQWMIESPVDFLKGMFDDLPKEKEYHKYLWRITHDNGRSD